MLKTIINNLQPLAHLSVRDKDLIESNAHLLTIRMGEYLFKKGEKKGFDYYLVEGKIEIQSENKTPYAIYGGTDIANHPLSEKRPHEHSAKAISQVKVLQINHDILRTLSTSEHDTATSEPESVETDDWMSRILQSDLICNIPSENIQLIFNSFEQLNTKKGDIIISQGDAGDYFYIIISGRCQVTKKIVSTGEIQNVAELSDTDCFGEESLIGDTKRNASVAMLTDGVLMRLNKKDFVTLIKGPLLLHLSTLDVHELQNGQNILLDVRSESEHQIFTLQSAINIPLNNLRDSLKILDVDEQYITYCDDGKRSSIAAYLLTQLGYKVSYLQGGLISHGMLENNNQDQKASQPDRMKSSNSTNNDDRIYKIVEKMICASQKGEEELAKNLNVMLSNMYQQLHKAMEEKEAAEELLKTLQ
jgi:CRP-like cAMP-binding protein